MSHSPINVYEMTAGQEALLAQIEAGVAVLAMMVCSECAPGRVLRAIDEGELDLSDGDALDAQWPCTAAAHLDRADDTTTTTEATQ